jgi:hypothetical protein
MLYFTKCYQYLTQIENKTIEHYVFLVDLYSNLSITYLQYKSQNEAKNYLKKAE